MFEHVFDLGSLHSRVNRHCNCTGEEAGKIRDRYLGAIEHVYCDPVAGLGAARDEATREALRLAIELRVGDQPVFQIKSGLVWNATSGIAQQGCKGHDQLLQVWRARMR